MLIPLALGVLVNTFAPESIRIGGFTQALFKDGALPLIAVLVTAILAPIVASWVFKRQGGLTVHNPVIAVPTTATATS